MSSRKWLPVAMTANQTQTGQRSQSARDHQRRRSARGDADDQRVRRVQARHRGVRVRGELDQAAAVVERRRRWRACRRSRGRGTSAAGRWAGGRTRRARSRLRAGSSCGGGGSLVPAEVDPEQCDPDDGELRVPVRARGEAVSSWEQLTSAGGRSRRARRWRSMSITFGRSRSARRIPVGEAADDLVGERNPNQIATCRAGRPAARRKRRRPLRRAHDRLHAWLRRAGSGGARYGIRERGGRRGDRAAGGRRRGDEEGGGCGLVAEAEEERRRDQEAGERSRRDGVDAHGQRAW